MPVFVLILWLWLVHSIVFAETIEHVDMMVVDEPTWRQDIAGPWWKDLLPKAEGDQPRCIPHPLIVPTGSLPIPVPDAQGDFSFEDWTRFIESPMNPQKNCVRLLGTPHDVRVTRDGSIIISWTGPRLHGCPSEQGLIDMSPCLTIKPPGNYQWDYHPIQEQRSSERSRHDQRM